MARQKRTSQHSYLYSLRLTEDERNKLQRLAEAAGYADAAPFIRRFILEQASKQEQKEAAYA